jgi:uncharacterized protein (DUF1778 family)
MRIAQAAAALRQPVSTFVLGVAVREADMVLAGADVTLIPAEQFDALMASPEIPDQAPRLLSATSRPRRFTRECATAVQGAGATRARTLDRVDHVTRSLVADLAGVDYAAATVAVEVQVKGLLTWCARQGSNLRPSDSKSARSDRIQHHHSLR